MNCLVSLQIRFAIFYSLSPVTCHFWLLAIGYWLLAIGCWLLAFGCWLLAFGFLIFVIKLLICWAKNLRRKMLCVKCTSCVKCPSADGCNLCFARHLLQSVGKINSSLFPKGCLWQGLGKGLIFYLQKD